VRQYLR
jgi:bifunctional N-acetylglutamate synthase/kinase